MTLSFTKKVDGRRFLTSIDRNRSRLRITPRARLKYLEHASALTRN